MKSSTQILGIAAGLLLAMMSGAAFAADAAALDFDYGSNNTPAFSQLPGAYSFTLAANEVTTTDKANATVQTGSSSVMTKPVKEEKDSLYSLNKMHRHLGISTILAALITAATAPGEGCEANCQPNQQRQMNGPHAHWAKATVALAAATTFTGVLAHWDDIHLENGITDPDNLHALLGVTGALLMNAAVNKSLSRSTGTVSHAAQAELGAALMAVGIKIVW